MNEYTTKPSTMKPNFDETINALTQFKPTHRIVTSTPKTSISSSFKPLYNTTASLEWTTASESTNNTYSSNMNNVFASDTTTSPKPITTSNNVLSVTTSRPTTTSDKSDLFVINQYVSNEVPSGTTYNPFPWRSTRPPPPLLPHKPNTHVISSQMTSSFWQQLTNPQATHVRPSAHITSPPPNTTPQTSAHPQTLLSHILDGLIINETLDKLQNQQVTSTNSSVWDYQNVHQAVYDITSTPDDLINYEQINDSQDLHGLENLKPQSEPVSLITPVETTLQSISNQGDIISYQPPDPHISNTTLGSDFVNQTLKQTIPGYVEPQKLSLKPNDENLSKDRPNSAAHDLVWYVDQGSSYPGQPHFDYSSSWITNPRPQLPPLPPPTRPQLHPIPPSTRPQLYPIPPSNRPPNKTPNPQLFEIASTVVNTRPTTTRPLTTAFPSTTTTILTTPETKPSNPQHSLSSSHDKTSPASRPQILRPLSVPDVQEYLDPLDGLSGTSQASASDYDFSYPDYEDSLKSDEHVSDPTSHESFGSAPTPLSNHIFTPFVIVKIWQMRDGQLSIVGEEPVPIEMFENTGLSNGAIVNPDDIPNEVLSLVSSKIGQGRSQGNSRAKRSANTGYSHPHTAPPVVHFIIPQGPDTTDQDLNSFLDKLSNTSKECQNEENANYEHSFASPEYTTFGGVGNNDPSALHQPEIHTHFPAPSKVATDNPAPRPYGGVGNHNKSDLPLDIGTTVKENDLGYLQVLLQLAKQINQNKRNPTLNEHLTSLHALQAGRNQGGLIGYSAGGIQLTKPATTEAPLLQNPTIPSEHRGSVLELLPSDLPHVNPLLHQDDAPAEYPVPLKDVIASLPSTSTLHREKLGQLLSTITGTNTFSGHLGNEGFLSQNGHAAQNSQSGNYGTQPAFNQLTTTSQDQNSNRVEYPKTLINDRNIEQFINLFNNRNTVQSNGSPVFYSGTQIQRPLLNQKKITDNNTGRQQLSSINDPSYLDYTKVTPKTITTPTPNFNGANNPHTITPAEISSLAENLPPNVVNYLLSQIKQNSQARPQSNAPHISPPQPNSYPAFQPQHAKPGIPAQPSTQSAFMGQTYQYPFPPSIHPPSIRPTIPQYSGNQAYKYPSPNYSSGVSYYSLPEKESGTYTDDISPYYETLIQNPITPSQFTQPPREKPHGSFPPIRPHQTDTTSFLDMLQPHGQPQKPNPVQQTFDPNSPYFPAQGIRDDLPPTITKPQPATSDISSSPLLPIIQPSQIINPVPAAASSSSSSTSSSDFHACTQNTVCSLGLASMLAMAISNTLTLPFLPAALLGRRRRDINVNSRKIDGNKDTDKYIRKLYKQLPSLLDDDNSDFKYMLPAAFEVFSKLNYKKILPKPFRNEYEVSKIKKYANMFKGLRSKDVDELIKYSVANMTKESIDKIIINN